MVWQARHASVLISRSPNAVAVDLERLRRLLDA
jgi:hypothetical protein